MDPTLVNGQITDAVTQANVTVLGNATAQATANLYQVMAHSVGLSMQNAVANQQNMNSISNAVTAQGVNNLYTVPVAADAKAVNTVLTDNQVAAIIAALAAAKKA